MPGQIFVLDTTAFIGGTAFSMSDQLYTVPGVMEELKRSADKKRFEYHINAGLKVQSPEKRYLAEIDKKSLGTGDSGRLSQIDKSLIALALELNATLVTDDYSLQNLAAELKIPYLSLGEKGITRIIHWELKCTGCARIYDREYENCPVCGSALKSTKKTSKRTLPPE